MQVFDTESHASAQSDKTKEGLSLFGDSCGVVSIFLLAHRLLSGILNNTRTTLGRFLLRQWLLRPSLSLSVISARHDAVECLVKPENIVSADTMCNHLKGLKNVPRTLRIMKSGKAGLNEWRGLVQVRWTWICIDAVVVLSDCRTEVYFSCIPDPRASYGSK